MSDPFKVKTKDPKELRRRINNAIEVMVRYGQIDGGHHKMWVIDQAIRALMGGELDEDDCLTASKAYKKMVIAAKDGDDGPDTYSWDQGIAP